MPSTILINIEFRDQSDPAYIEEVSDWLALDALKREFGKNWDRDCEKAWDEMKAERRELKAIAKQTREEGK